MKLFLYIACCAAVASALSLIMQYTIGPRPVFELVASGLFFLTIAGCVYIEGTDPLVTPERLVLAPLAFTTASTGLAIAGMFVFTWSPTLGVVLISPMGLGYYPSGPDVPFVYGAAVWALSMILLVGGALTLGIILRSLRTGRHPSS